jgi:hypothetical protein
MSKEEEIEYLTNLRKSVFSMNFSKSNVKYLEELIQSEYDRELNKEEPNKLYLKNLDLTISRSLDRLMNSNKKVENRIEEFKECQMDLWNDIFKGLSNLK